MGVTALLATRFKDFVAGKAVAVDVPIILIWIALLVLPLFQEVTLFGMTFKKELEALKADVKDEVTGLRSEIRNAVDVRTQINPIFFPGPPPDSQLPNIEKKIQAALEDALKARGGGGAAVPAQELLVPSDADMLFRARYNIERELRRIWRDYSEEESFGRRFLPTLRIAQTLAHWEVIDRSKEPSGRFGWSRPLLSTVRLLRRRRSISFGKWPLG